MHHKPEIKIIDFEPWHLEILNVKDKQKYVYEYLEQVNVTPEKYGEDLLSNAIIFKSYYKDGEILGCGGIIKTPVAHICECICIFGKDFNKCFKTALKEIKKELSNCNYERIQAFTEVDFEEAQRFLEWLGFQKEGVLRKQGTDKRDNIIYSIVK